MLVPEPPPHLSGLIGHLPALHASAIARVPGLSMLSSITPVVVRGAGGCQEPQSQPARPGHAWGSDLSLNRSNRDGASRQCKLAQGKHMKFLARPTAFAFACVTSASVCTGLGTKYAPAQSVRIEELAEQRGPSSKLELTPEQRNAIYQEVHKGSSKVAPSRFASVPPIIDLYTPPGDILAKKPKATSSPRWMIK
jgi:hypothetical protein